MSLPTCINRATGAGLMNPQRAAAVLQQYNNAFAAFQQSMGYSQAQIAAAQAVVKATKIAAAQKRRGMQLQAATTTRPPTLTRPFPDFGG